MRKSMYDFGGSGGFDGVIITFGGSSVGPRENDLGFDGWEG